MRPVPDPVVHLGTGVSLGGPGDRMCRPQFPSVFKPGSLIPRCPEHGLVGHIHEEVSMSVVARFYVSSVEKKAGDTAVVHMQPVVSKENARWSTYTPAGEIRLDLTRKASGAREVFEANIGKEALITFDFEAPDREEPPYVAGEGYQSDE